METTPIFFVTQAGVGIGLGHIRRSLAIAKEMRKEGFNNILFAAEGFSSIAAWVKGEGFSLIDMNSLSGQDEGVAIIDRKDDVSEDIKTFRKNGLKVCLIDNATPARLHCDLAIYPIAHFADDPNWDSFQGIRLVRSEFFPLSEEFLAFESTPLRERENILITMGGTDFNNLTLKTLKAIKHINDIEVNIVVGPAFKHQQELLNFSNTLGTNFRLHFNVTNMPELMNQSAIAITAFGITLYELAFMGVPAIIINNYIRDTNNVEVFAQQGTAIPLGYYEAVTSGQIFAAVERVRTNKALVRDMAMKGRSLVDGKGSKRIVSAIEKHCLPKKQVITK